MARIIRGFNQLFSGNLVGMSPARQDEYQLEVVEVLDDQRLRDDYASVGRGAAALHLRDFRAHFSRDLTLKERDDLGFLIDVKPKTNRPFAHTNLDGVQYEISLLPAPQGPGMIWKILVRDKRKEHRAHIETGALRLRLRDLFLRHSPAAAERLERLE